MIKFGFGFFLGGVALVSAFSLGAVGGFLSGVVCSAKADVINAAKKED